MEGMVFTFKEIESELGLLAKVLQRKALTQVWDGLWKEDLELQESQFPTLH